MFVKYPGLPQKEREAAFFIFLSPNQII